MPQIKKVKDREGVKYKPLHPHLPQPCANVLHISPVKTGKSTIISNLLLSPEFYGQDYFDRVKIMSNTIMNDDTSRFLKDAFDVSDHYDDSIVDGLIASQNKFDKEEMPSLAVICDDLLGSIKREAKINHLASRFRHWNIQLLYYSSQSFRKVNNVVRQNATNVIIGSPFPNQKELNKIAEEYGDMFGGMMNFLRIYKIATPNRYDFLHLDLQENPPVAYHNFEKPIAIGEKIISGDKNISIEEEDEEVEEVSPPQTRSKTNQSV